MSAARVLLAIAALCCALPAAGETPALRPHVVLISLDTLRADHLSAFGYARETSPRLAVGVFVGVALLAAVVGMLSPALRAVPSLGDRKLESEDPAPAPEPAS